MEKEIDILLRKQLLETAEVLLRVKQFRAAKELLAVAKQYGDKMNLPSE